MKNPFQGIKGIRVLPNENLSAHTSFHVGGPAEYFVHVYTKKALGNVLRRIRQRRMKYFLIGAGTNLLVADVGFRGVVLKLGGTFKRGSIRGGKCRCGAGMLINEFLTWTADKGYGGAEFLAGIPGTMGGAAKGNAGAFGRSIADVTESIVIIDRRCVERTKSRKEIGFGYRRSRVREDEIITEINLLMNRQKRGTVLRKISKILKKRERKHPKGYSAGSFFKNPDCAPAGKLIEKCGLKGLAVGDAEISKRHGNYIINRGAARAADIIALSSAVRKAVRRKTGILLKQEVRILK